MTFCPTRADLEDECRKRTASYSAMFLRFETVGNRSTIASCGRMSFPLRTPNLSSHPRRRDGVEAQVSPGNEVSSPPMDPLVARVDRLLCWEVLAEWAPPGVRIPIAVTMTGSGHTVRQEVGWA